ncbi:MAG TPA: hypothetical protein VI756_05560 [Blastocatellia bacterium]
MSAASVVLTRVAWVDEQGRFEIRGLIDGRYAISTSHVPGARAISQVVTVADGQAPEVTVVLDMSKNQ